MTSSMGLAEKLLSALKLMPLVTLTTLINKTKAKMHS